MPPFLSLVWARFLACIHANEAAKLIVWKCEGLRRVIETHVSGRMVAKAVGGRPQIVVGGMLSDYPPIYGRLYGRSLIEERHAVGIGRRRGVA